MTLRISFGFTNPGIENPSRAGSCSKLARIWSYLYIAYWLEVGCCLILFPWYNFWENNYILNLCPSLRPIMVNPFLKGAVLGLGIVNLLIGFQEIVQLRKGPRSFLSR